MPGIAYLQQSDRDFLVHYSHTMDSADVALVFFNPQTILHKRLAMIAPAEVKQAFDNEGLLVFTEKQKLEKYLGGADWDNKVLLMMSSGNFSGIDFKHLANNLLDMV